MVKFWEEQLKIAIQKHKYLINICEKHGIGKTAMETKERLKKAQKMLEDRK